MATSIDYSGAIKRVIVPQSDLTLITGSLYELDTDVLRTDLKSLEANETGIIFNDTHRRNAPYTVAGITYSQSIEMLNSSNSSQEDEYELFFDPDTTYSVRLAGSNNNLSDIQNAILANTVTQVIPTNSAGLIALPEIKANVETIIDLLCNNGDITVSPAGEPVGSKRVKIYEDDGITIKAQVLISADGLTRTREI